MRKRERKNVRIWLNEGNQESDFIAISDDDEESAGVSVPEVQATRNAEINFPCFVYPRFRKRNKDEQTGITVIINLQRMIYEFNVRYIYIERKIIYKEKSRYQFTE